MQWFHSQHHFIKLCLWPHPLLPTLSCPNHPQLLASLLLLQHTVHTPTSGPLHLLFPLPEIPPPSHPFQHTHAHTHTQTHTIPLSCSGFPNLICCALFLLILFMISSPTQEWGWNLCPSCSLLCFQCLQCYLAPKSSSKIFEWVNEWMGFPGGTSG